MLCVAIYLTPLLIAISREFHVRPRVEPSKRFGFHTESDGDASGAPELVAPSGNATELFKCCEDEHSICSRLFGCKIFPNDPVNPFHGTPEEDGGEDGAGGAVVVPSAPVDGDMDPTATEHDTRFTNPLSAGFDDEKKPASPTGLEKE